jgi:hypothetical protein
VQVAVQVVGKYKLEAQGLAVVELVMVATRSQPLAAVAAAQIQRLDSAALAAPALSS